MLRQPPPSPGRLMNKNEDPPLHFPDRSDLAHRTPSDIKIRPGPLPPGQLEPDLQPEAAPPTPHFIVKLRVHMFIDARYLY